MTTSQIMKGHSLRVSRAFVLRGLMRMRRLPSLMLPAIIMPIFFVVAFSGSFASVVQLEGYGTDKAVNWMAAWAVLQGAAFSGLGGGGMTATDLENGFFDRIRTAPINPYVLISGLVGYSICRAVIPTTAVLIISFAFLGAEMPGGTLGFFMVYLAAIGVATIMAFFILGIVFTFKSVKSLAIGQIFMFSSMFLSVGQAPLEAIEGWLYVIAKFNPISHIIRMCRQGFLGEVTWDQTQSGLIAILCLTAGAAIWARTCYRKVDI
ncbi:MAG: ABC transporter permease [Actinomycetota bacterium]